MPNLSSLRHSFLILLTVLSVSSLCLMESADAQQGQGVLLVTNWPDEETKRTGKFEILPFIDTLSIAYRYRDVESRPDLSIVLEWTPGAEAIYEGERVGIDEIDGYPAMVGLGLTADVISAGSRVAEFSMVVDSMIVQGSPDIIRIDMADINWDNLFVDTPGEVARDIFAAGFELRNAQIISVGFAVFEGGRRVADTAVEKDTGGDRRRPPHVGPRRPRNVSIYRYPGHVNVGFDLFWLIGTGHRRIRLGDDGPRENIGRGSLGGNRRSRAGRNRDSAGRGRGGSVDVEGRGNVDGDGRRNVDGDGRRIADGDGRSSIDDARRTIRGRSGRNDGAESEPTGRGRGDDAAAAGDVADGKGDDDAGESNGEARGKDGRSRTSIPGFGKSSDDDDDDDDDDDKLVPYAIAAVAAAGVLAAVGGTIGYYGNARYAPFGLTSGIVRNEGGLLLQVAVNEALIAGHDGPKRLTGRALSFGNLFGSDWLQPAIGAGVMATSRGSAVEYEPSVSFGGVVRHNMILFYGGYDVMQGSPEFSFAIDLRRMGRWGSRRD